MGKSNGIFEFRDGRSVFIEDLQQRVTYKGLLEGFPTTKMNDAIIASAEKLADWDCNHIVIQPRRTPITGFGEDPFGTPEKIPEIQCVAAARSIERPSSGQGDYSRLAIVWWQDDFAFPIEATVLSNILNIDWAAQATFFDY